MEHRRSDRRFLRTVPIYVRHDGGELNGTTRNISLGGVFIDCDRRFPFGAKVFLRFTVPTQEEAIEVDGQVRWTEADENGVRGIGVQFGGLRARDVWALNKFFEMPLEEDLLELEEGT